MRVGISLTETTNTATLGGPIIRTRPVKGKQYELDTRTIKLSCVALPDFVVRQELSSAGLELYVKEPTVARPNAWQLSMGGPGVISTGWAVRVQIILKGCDQNVWHFPAPEPKDPLRYNNAIHERIDYTKTQQAFWADEVYYRANI